MRTVVVDYAHRAEECRWAAKLAAKAEDQRHFLEMAETWELLRRQQYERARREGREPLAAREMPNEVGSQMPLKSWHLGPPAQRV